MLHELFHTYKKIILCVLLVSSLAILWFFGYHRGQEKKRSVEKWEQITYEDGGYGYAFETEQLQGEVVFGIKGYTVKNEDIPIVVKVHAPKSDFSGIVKITVPGNNGGGIAYQSALQCQKQEDTEVKIYVPQLGNASYFCFEIEDQYGTSQLARMEIPAYSEWQEEETSLHGQICLGILSDDPEKFTYMDGLSLYNSEGQVRLRTVPLDADTFPAAAENLSMLSGILVDDFSVETMTKKQKNALYRWVKDGGNLIVGTGEHAQKVLEPFQKKLVIRVEEVETSCLEFREKQEFSGEIFLDLSQLQFQKNDGWEKVNWSDPSSFYQRNYGEGVVQVLRFSFTDESLPQWSYLDKMTISLFEQLFDNVFENNLDEENGLWNMEMALHGFNQSQVPNAFYYGCFFLVYICTLTYIAYFMLRRLKRREYIWIVVPVLSLFFTSFLLVRSRGNEAQTQGSLSAIRVVDDQSPKNDVYFLYQNAEGESRDISLISAIEKVTPLDYEYQQDKVEYTLLKKIQENYTISHTRKGYTVSFSEASPGTMRMLSMQENKTQNYGEKPVVIEAKIQGDHTTFSGMIQNRSDKNFDRIFLIRGNEFWSVANVKAGESRMVQASDVKCWYPEDSTESILQKEEGDQVLFHLLGYLEYRYLKNNNDLSQVTILGITKNDTYQLLSGGERLGNQLSVYANHMTMDVPEQAECSVNINQKYRKDGTTYWEFLEEVREKENPTVEYRFDSNKVVWAMARNQDEFEGKIYAYNYETGEKEEILSNGGDVMDCYHLEPYLSDQNDMKLTYEPAEDEEWKLPVLSLWMKKSGRTDEEMSKTDGK